MRTPTLNSILSVLIATVVIGGCATHTPVLDEHFGEAVNTAIAQQTINPDASLNNDPVAGVDGEVAAAAMDRYYESYTEPPPSTNIFTIGIGSGGSGSGSDSNGNMSGSR